MTSIYATTMYDVNNFLCHTIKCSNIKIISDCNAYRIVKNEEKIEIAINEDKERCSSTQTMLSFGG